MQLVRGRVAGKAATSCSTVDGTYSYKTAGQTLSHALYLLTR
jgi:hypothetical protein